MTIHISVNGKTRELPEPMTVLAFLELLKINPLAVAVELRGEALNRERFAESVIREGDVLEVVRMMGGG
jgi:sulfur carrier protein